MGCLKNPEILVRLYEVGLSFSTMLRPKEKILRFSLSRSLEIAISRVITIEKHTSICLLSDAYDIY